MLDKLDKLFIAKLLKGLKHGSIKVNYWDGTSRVYGSDKPEAQVTLHSRSVPRAIAINPSLGVGESYMKKLLEIDGSLDDFFRVFYENQKAFGRLLTTQAIYRRQVNKKHFQKSYIAHHYDLSNDFYKLWLDNDTMAYTCAYFRTPKDSLELAQTQKFDHVLRKLQLKKGHQVLDIGCGWGHLLVRAATKYGASGLGVTLSEEQFKYATQLAKDSGVADKVTFELLNYQDLYDRDIEFDRIMSVGIMEHVGKGNLANYFRVVEKLLKPNGVSFVHTITQQTELTTDAWTDKYIFPGGYLPATRKIISQLPKYNFRLLDYENLRIHYAMTLDEWLRRFEAHREEVIEMFDEEFYRMWRFWLAASSASFRYGPSDLSQFVFTKGINNELPLTRDHLAK